MIMNGNRIRSRAIFCMIDQHRIALAAIASEKAPQRNEPGRAGFQRKRAKRVTGHSRRSGRVDARTSFLDGREITLNENEAR
jgi:hypothetical protein